MKKVVKNFFKSKYRPIFEVSQKLGLNILPHHYYSNIPDIKYLKQNTFWLKPNSMIDVEMNTLEEQMSFVRECCSVEDLQQLPSKNIHERAIEENNGGWGFGTIEAEFLHCFIKSRKPSQIVQVGCGISTSVILKAASEINHKINITCIEPYPTSFLNQKSDSGEINLIRQKGQEVDLEIFTNLQAGDVLFVDSTHTVKTGSEVNYIILEILPRLKKGVFVHFHDIYFPFDYGRNILTKDLFFWNESSLLHAFLIGNKRYKIIVCQSMLHYECSKELGEIFKNYNPQDNYYGLSKGETKGKHFPSSIYLKTMI